MFNVLLQLTENDKRVILALLLFIILFFVLIGYLGMIVKRVINYQGKKLDYYVADPVTTRVITTPRHFVKYARKKNAYVFYRKALMPVVIIFISIGLWMISNIWLGWDYNPFTDVDKGFASILFLWDFQDPDCWTQFFGTPLYIFTSWPPLVHTPTFHIESLGVYLFVIGLIIGGFWYLHQVTCYIARELRIRKLKNTIFSKNLDNFSQLNTLNENAPQSGTFNNPNNPQ